MKTNRAFYSPATGAYIHSYEPLRLYIYNHRSFPYDTLNPLAKALVYNDARYCEGRHLFTLVDEPDEASLFVFPCDLNYFERREDLVYNLLPFYQGNERRHVFFDHRDQPDPFPADNSIRFKVSLHQQQVSDTLICIPYVEAVDNFFWYFREPRRIKFDLSFIGERLAFREQVLDLLSDSFESTYFRLREQFFHGGYLQFNDGRLKTKQEPLEKRSWRDEFISISRQSKFVMALRGYGLNTFRFFESLSLGVPPILLSDSCALPYEHLVNYDKICIRVEENDAGMVERIKEAVYGMDDSAYAEMCRAGRLHYDSFFSARNYLFLLYEALTKAINQRVIVENK